MGAVQGINLVGCDKDLATSLSEWYNGPTLVDLLGMISTVGKVLLSSHILSSDHLTPPVRDIIAPLRIPVSNVFKRQSSSVSISGRICGGIVQVGEKLRVLPGDETAIVKGELNVALCPAIGRCVDFF